MIRRLNTRLNDVLPNHHYRAFVREMVVHRNLSGAPRLAAALAARGRLRVGQPTSPGPGSASSAPAGVRRRRQPRRPAAQTRPKPFVDPDDCDESQVADAALDALTVMTMETAKLRDVELELHGVIQDLMGQLDRFHGTPTYRAKERLVALSRTNVVARGGLSAYRRLRGRNSRST